MDSIYLFDVFCVMTPHPDLTEECNVKLVFMYELALTLLNSSQRFELVVYSGLFIE